MKSIVPGLVIAALALALSVAPAHASPPATAHVYLGQLGDNGRLVEPKFDGVPVIKVGLEQTANVQLFAPAAIVAKEGMKVRSAASASAPALGRLASGSRVRLLSVHASFGYVWGEVDLSGAKVLAVLPRRPEAYASNGFTGRSGTSPSRAGVLDRTGVALSEVPRRAHVLPLAMHVRIFC